MSDLNPTVNSMVRVLEGTRLKFTCRLNRQDGSAIEWQSESPIKMEWQEATRSVWWVGAAAYVSVPVVAQMPGDVMICEENPQKA